MFLVLFLTAKTQGCRKERKGHFYAIYGVHQSSVAHLGNIGRDTFFRGMIFWCGHTDAPMVQIPSIDRVLMWIYWATNALLLHRVL